MIFSVDLLLEAVAFGILLWGFYAAVSLGLSVAFGLLDIPHVAHPAVLVLGAYGAYLLGNYGFDHIVAGLMLTPLFFALGAAFYRVYHFTFESRGDSAAVNGLAFFFGIVFIIEVLLVIFFGVDQRSAEAPYIGGSFVMGDMRLPYRLLVAFAVAIVLAAALSAYLSRTFYGRAIKAVGQDESALRLMGANPVKVKQLAFGIATGVNALAGAVLLIMAPVEPTMDRMYIGRTFCVVVLAGLGSMSGTIVAGLILGITESIVLMFIGTAWAPAVAFTLLLIMLAVRPQGLFGR